MLVSALITYLKTQSNVTALLAYHPKATGEPAIYANVPVENTPSPFIVISYTDGEDVWAIQGDQGLTDALLDIEVYTEETQGYGKIESIKEQLRQSLTTIGTTWGTVPIQQCRLSHLRDDDFPPPERGNNWVQEAGWQAQVWFEQSKVVT